MVEYGYFKAGKRFFFPQYYYERDMDYVARQLGLSKNFPLASLYHLGIGRHYQ